MLVLKQQPYVCVCVHASPMSLCLWYSAWVTCVRFPTCSTLSVCWLWVCGCRYIPVGQSSSCALWPLPYSDNIDVSFAAVYRWLTYPVHERAYTCCSKHAVSGRKVLCRAGSDVIYISGRSHSYLFWVKTKQELGYHGQQRMTKRQREHHLQKLHQRGRSSHSHTVWLTGDLWVAQHGNSTVTEIGSKKSCIVFTTVLSRNCFWLQQ